MARNWSAPKIILTVWLVFSVLYFAWNEWGRFKVYVMNQSYQKGVSDAVLQVMQQSEKCQAFPVYAGEKSVNLLNAACVQDSKAPSTEEKK